MSAPTFLVTEPGVVDGMPEDVYHADPVPAGSLSSGGARLLLEPGGPAKFDHGRRNKRASTKAFDLGHAAHTMALGAGAGILVVEAANWQTKAAKEAKADAYAAGQIPVLADDYQRVVAMVAAIRAHPLAGALIQAEGPVEQSMFWIDPDTGVWCRARPDKSIRDRTGRLILIDLKTCENASEAGTSKSIGNYGYHQQDPWYRNGAVACGQDTDPGFLFIFVEKSPPHLINVVQVIAEDVAVGQRRNAAALRLYAECTAAGRWPGYGDDITEVALPAYYPRQEY
jgi:hypothetical protein